MRPARTNRPGTASEGPSLAWRLLTVLVCLVVWLAVPADGAAEPPVPAPVEGEAVAGPEPAPADEPQTLLLGIVVGDREVAVVDAYWDGEELLLPVEQVLEFCECEGSVGDETLRVVTPIGTATLGAPDLLEHDGTLHVRASALRRLLAIELEYDPAKLALVLDIPWSGMRLGAREMQALTPDIDAPEMTLSYANLNAVYTQNSTSENGTASAVMMGRFGGGLWRMRVADGFGSSLTANEYGWMRSLGEDGLMLLGNQRFGLSPLLGSLELTGAQAAWTNAPLNVFGAGRVAGELLPRQLNTRTTISGQGIPAGIAVLRVDDRQVAATVIDLAGTYEFTGVVLPTNSSSRVEVLIYDRQNPTVPVEIRDHSTRASDTMLPGGTAVVQGAFGSEGNPLGRATSTNGGFAGFAQGRYGVSDAVTVETLAQTGARGTSLVAGGVAQLARGFVVSAAGGVSDGNLGYHLELDGERRDWRLRARSQSMQQGFRYTGSGAYQDHYLDLSHAIVGGRVEIGVVGRYERSEVRTTAFVLPSLYLRPTRELMLRARPDSTGGYRVDANWRPDRNWRVGFTRAQTVTTAIVARQISAALQGELLVQAGDLGTHRQAALLSWTGRGRWSPALSGGPLFTNGKPGALLRAQAEVLPGVLLGLQYETMSLIGDGLGAPDQRLSFSLTTRHAIAGTRLVPGVAPVGADARGGIAGKLTVVAPYQVSPEDLEHVVIRVNGRAAGTTTRGGKFYIAGLEPGVYRVEVDPSVLPIELSYRETRRLVEVAAASVSSVDFELDVEFGFAGRVRVGAANAPGIALELLDARGEIVGTARTDRFGLYRIDNVGIGSYELRVAAENAPELAVEWPRRSVMISNDFLYDQDLQLVDSEPMRALVAEAAPVVAKPVVEDLSVAAEPETASVPDPDVEESSAPAGHIVDRATVTAVAPSLELESMPIELTRSASLATPDRAVDSTPLFHASTSVVVTAKAPLPELVAPTRGALARVPNLGSSPPPVLPQPQPQSAEVFAMAPRGTASPPHLHVRVRVVAPAPAVVLRN